ncbi:MAG: hypothetical protein ACQEWI_14425 [Bacillota bacterium]
MKVGWDAGFENKWWRIENKNGNLKIKTLELKIKSSLEEQDESKLSIFSPNGHFTA